MLTYILIKSMHKTSAAFHSFSTRNILEPSYINLNQAQVAIRIIANNISVTNTTALVFLSPHSNTCLRIILILERKHVGKTSLEAKVTGRNEYITQGTIDLTFSAISSSYKIY